MVGEHRGCEHEFEGGLELILLPPGNHAGKDGAAAQVDRMTSTGGSGDFNRGPSRNGRTTRLYKRDGQLCIDRDCRLRRRD